MITTEILSEIRKAVEDPVLYSPGEEKNRLRAASQICCDLLKKKPTSRIDVRQELNAYMKKGRSAAKRKIIGVLNEAMREGETSLHAKGYTDHTEATEAFINNQLKPLYEALT